MTRCAGGRWRLLVHDRLPKAGPDGVLYGKSRSVASSRKLAGEDSEHLATTVLEDTEFDELATNFVHIEQMDSRVWWINAGGLIINIRVDRDGRPRSVTAELEPVEGVEYRFDA